MKTKLYHTTGTKFKPGDVFGGPGLTVFMSTSPIPHSTIQEIVTGGYSCYKDYEDVCEKKSKEYWDLREAWNENPVGDKPEYPNMKNPNPVKLWVYEVKPFEKPVWINVNEEYRVDDVFVEVVRVVGNAKGILDNHKRKFGETSKAYFFGGTALRTVKNT